jgi:hypothetical protein
MLNALIFLLGISVVAVALLLIGFLWLSIVLWWNAYTMSHEYEVRRYGWREP